MQCCVIDVMWFNVLLYLHLTLDISPSTQLRHISRSQSISIIPIIVHCCMLSSCFLVFLVSCVHLTAASSGPASRFCRCSSDVDDRSHLSLHILVMYSS